MLEWMGLNFYHYDGLQPKMSAGIINEHEHECMYIELGCKNPSILTPCDSVDVAT